MLILVFLWGSLINHLRIEWALNPQYGYGWAVPCLCVFLIWRKMNQRAENAASPAIAIATAAPRELPGAGFAMFALAVLWLPLRLIQEANPEWRLVSWVLSLVVIGLSLLVLNYAGPTARLSLRTRDFAFPLFFFLVAVPWPTVFETPMIQALTHANASATVEVLRVLNIPAIQHGNVIEVSTGVVGIDEACSGIRSFQASLMIALFFGEYYLLTTGRRVACVLAGFALSFLFNLVRTTLLTSVAAKSGIAAISRWHDPAGVTILLGCFICLWLLALRLQKRPPQGNVSASATATSDPLPISASTRVPVVLLYLLTAWLVMAEVGTELWYRIHEWRLPPPVTWQVELPTDNPTFAVRPISEKSRQYLRYSEAKNAAWRGPDGTSWQTIYLRWDPGRTAVHLAKNHTPEICLEASGRKVLSQAPLRHYSVNGLELPVIQYRISDESGPLQVFYCLWEDRPQKAKRDFSTMLLGYANRLEPVLAGRRNSGQRSLEIAVWGIADDAEAEAAFRGQLTRLVHVRQ